MQVDRGRDVAEVGRQGEWVRVEVLGTGGTIGWIHASLLAAPQGVAVVTEETQLKSGDQVAVPGPGALEATETLETAKTDTTGGSAGDTAALDPPEVNRFKESVSYLNDRAMQVAGVDLFTAIKPVDPETVAVGTTEAWTTVPPAGQRSYINTLVDRWSAANGGERPVKVQILDPKGQVLVEQSGP
jgi:hypothetical protein